MNINFNNLADIFNMLNSSKPKAPEKAGEPPIFSLKSGGPPQQPTIVTTTQIIINTANLAPRTNLGINNSQMNFLMKDLMGLPKELSDFLSKTLAPTAQNESFLKNLTTNQKMNQQSLMELLKLNPEINLEKLATILNESSANLNSKMLKLIQSSGMDKETIARMKEAMLLGTSVSVVNPTLNDTVKNLLLLYLPYLPLNPEKEILEELDEKFPKEELKNTEITFYLTTEELGIFKISILTEEACEIYILNITKEKSEETEKSILEKIKLNTEKFPLETKIFSKTKVDEELEKKPKKQLFIINSTNSMMGILLIQIIAQSIFEIDEKIKISTKRKDKLEN